MCFLAMHDGMIDQDEPVAEPFLSQGLDRLFGCRGCAKGAAKAMTRTEPRT